MDGIIHKYSQYSYSRHEPVTALTKLESLQASQLEYLLFSKVNQYVANVLIQEIGSFQHIQPNEVGDFNLFNTFACHVGNTIRQNKIEYKKFDLSRKTMAMSEGGFSATINGEGTYAQRLILKLVESFKALGLFFTIYRHLDNPLAYTVITHGSNDSNFSYTQSLGTQHYFVISTVVTNKE